MFLIVQNQPSTSNTSVRRFLIKKFSCSQTNSKPATSPVFSFSEILLCIFFGSLIASLLISSGIVLSLHASCFREPNSRVVFSQERIECNGNSYNTGVLPGLDEFIFTQITSIYKLHLDQETNLIPFSPQEKQNNSCS